ncbi:Kua-UEV1_localn domain-containing protein [Cephalotus follicularis]|uniref:Kua-UEV1_localn domain-containing protein n=1 Tax=Cephalotus follicularis TaxID=3775 RepID=A0A1Q3BKX8_CEPFO|nr:Kua-UEV1_localn domain-containing protein [Cephalotus follicularis]
MSILPQKMYPIRSLHHVPKCRHPCLHAHVMSSSVTTSTKLRSNPNQQIIEPRLVTPPPLVKETSPPLLNDPSLQSTWTHRAWLASGCTTVFISLAKCIAGATNSHIGLQPMLAASLGYILADLGSGVYHWGIDNYGDPSTPIFGAQIEAFQGHHKWPWTITRRQFANNLHALARATTFVVLPIDLICNDAIVHAFVSVCSGCIMFSQQYHAWAHGTKSRLPPLVVALQDMGVLVSRSQHATHHRPPYNNNYCIVSGVWNEFLDKHRVFEALEMVLYFKLGVRPRSWSEPSSEWIEENATPAQVLVH